MKLILLLLALAASAIGQEQPEQIAAETTDPAKFNNNTDVIDDDNKSSNRKLKKELKSMRAQMEEMMTEIRNQNHAIFKQADHNRILSGKVRLIDKCMFSY